MQSLAVKYRPTEFAEISDQAYIVRILKDQIAKGEPKSGYLFCGASGCGKTTIARIFADKINEGQGTPIELDAAKNSGVDNVRKIIEEAQFMSMSSKYKVYILDEVHMFSTGAWNAMLKILEEPPAGVIFIMCTTEPHKVPATIQNRLQRFNFQRINTEKITERLLHICDNERLLHTTDAIDTIADYANGGMRDAIAALEKVASYTQGQVINEEAVSEVLGKATGKVHLSLVNQIINKHTDEALQIVAELHDDGVDLKQFSKDFLAFVLGMCKKLVIAGEVSDRSIKLKDLLNNLLRLNEQLRYETEVRMYLEAAIILWGREQGSLS